MKAYHFYVLAMFSLDLLTNNFFFSLNESVLNASFGFASWLFNPLAFSVLLALSLWCIWSWEKGNRSLAKRDMVLLVGSVILAVVFSGLLKLLVNMPRPLDARFSVFGAAFPSMHTAAATAYFLALLHFAKRTANIWRKVLHYIFCILSAVFVGVSRLYFSVHWLSDVIAGYLIGGLAVYATIHIVRILTTNSQTYGSKPPKFSK